ncbi:MAG TPA: type VI secretion system baseplate subunit TssG [Longimicrobiales bacterium]|nr:type VI secretion system baseplate subunit TssG [Longimicrobiales bacterium]
MAAEDGVEGAPLNLHLLAEALRADPTGFGFFQAVRTLERLYPESASVGRSIDAAAEPVRFSVNPTIAFPPAELAALDLPEAGEPGPARLDVNFMGVAGPLGVLPYHYTLLVAERKRARDTALGDFLDIFHHRLLSLFYRAWQKHRFTVAYEKGEDRLRAHLLDLVGSGLDVLQKRASIEPDALVYYAGLLALQTRGAVALEQLLEDYFGVPVEVEQFVGGWYPVARTDQCELDDDGEGMSGQLGLGALAGDEVWDQQAKVRIRVGPLARSQYDRFLPSGEAFEQMRALTRFFSHDQFDFELQLVLAREDVPGFVLGAGEEVAQPLGWSTWIRSTAFRRDADDTVLSL